MLCARDVEFQAYVGIRNYFNHRVQLGIRAIDTSATRALTTQLCTFELWLADRSLVSHGELIAQNESMLFVNVS